METNNDKRVHMTFDDQIDYFARRAPSHIAGFVTADVGDLGLGFGGHGEEIAIAYRLRCSCGHDQFAVSACLWNANQLIAPVTAACAMCAKGLVVFDSEQHGYNPVACEMPAGLHGQKEEGTALVPISTSDDAKPVFVVAYYPDDLFEDGFEEFADRRSDLFTWLRIAIGLKDDPKNLLLDFECA